MHVLVLDLKRASLLSRSLNILVSNHIDQCGVHEYKGLPAYLLDACHKLTPNKHLIFHFTYMINLSTIMHDQTNSKEWQ